MVTAMRDATPDARATAERGAALTRAGPPTGQPRSAGPAQRGSSPGRAPRPACAGSGAGAHGPRRRRGADRDPRAASAGGGPTVFTAVGRTAPVVRREVADGAVWAAI